jgi:hypothetical protein
MPFQTRFLWIYLCKTGLVVVMAVATMSQSAVSATITVLGTDLTTANEWRSTSIAKTAVYDPNGDGAYGSDGYYVAYGRAAPEWSTPALIHSSLPSYVENVTVNPNISSYWYHGYPKLDDPSQPIGRVVKPPPPANMGLWNCVSNDTVDFFTIVLRRRATFVLTVIVGTNTTLESNSSAIMVRSSDGHSQSIRMRWSGHPDYAFFRLSGKETETFTVSLAGGGLAASSSGIAFETCSPEPATTLMLLPVARNAPTN